VKEAEVRYHVVFSSALFSLTPTEGVSESTGAASAAQPPMATAFAPGGQTTTTLSTSAANTARMGLPSYSPQLASALRDATSLLHDEFVKDKLLAWSPPYYLVDPGQPGSWYMRHRTKKAYEGSEPPYASGAPDGGLRGASLLAFRVRRKIRKGERRGVVDDGVGSDGDDDDGDEGGVDSQQPLSLAQRLASFKAVKAAQQGKEEDISNESGPGEHPPLNLWGVEDEEESMR